MSQLQTPACPEGQMKMQTQQTELKATLQIGEQKFGYISDLATKLYFHTNLNPVKMGSSAKKKKDKKKDFQVCLQYNSS